MTLMLILNRKYEIDSVNRYRVTERDFFCILIQWKQRK